jgi:hypothetical protein
LLKEKQYYCKRKEIAVNKELEQLEDKASLLKDPLLLEPVTRTANLNFLSLELIANLG